MFPLTQILDYPAPAAPGILARLRAWVSRKSDDLARPSNSPLVYRLCQWPKLPAGGLTADMYRTLSVMSQRPVNRSWILRTSRLKPAQVDSLLQWLVDTDAVEVIDTRNFVVSTQVLG